MTQFKKGDRVEYSHTDGNGDDRNNGRKGTVRSPGPIDANVDWDDGNSTPSYPHKANLRLLPAEFKIGDRVLIAKKMTGVGCPSWNSVAGMDKTLGKLGTIIEIGGYIRVRVDDGDTWFYGKASLEHVTKPSDEEVAKALAVLQMAGKVTFKPTKPPFVNKEVRLNSSYTAIVSDKCVTVGCQTFTFDAVDELAEAVAYARAYSEEK